MNYYAIIVAGGSGSRMQSDIPKQFLQLNGRPVLMHSIEAFYMCEFRPSIIVVLSEAFHKYWQEQCKEYNFKVPHQLVNCGEQRFHSVKNGLGYIHDSAIVAIHDAVRPCVTLEVIDSAFKQAQVLGNAVVSVKSRDSVRMKTDIGSMSIDRESIYLVQTPQVFTSEVLKKAYGQEYRSEFTDDASVVEMSGVNIELIEGDIRNVKITYPEDLLIAGKYLDSQK